MSCCAACAEHAATGLAATPAGFAPMWTPMPPLAGGYPVVAGYTYRVALTLGGLASSLGTRSSVASEAAKRGFTNVQVWMRGDALPSDYTNAPNADVYVGAVCGKSQTFPAVTSGGIWPLTGSATIVDARVWMNQPIGASPVPIPGAVTPPVATSAWKWVFGIAGATAVAYVGYRVVRRHERNRHHVLVP